MSMLTQNFIGFTDGAIHNIQNFSSTAWDIYSPTNELVSIHGIYLIQTTNNIEKYSVMIELFSEAISFILCQLIMVRFSTHVIAFK